MLPDEIAKQAERLRKTSVGMSNYATVLNDAFVIIRELAECVEDLTDRVESVEADTYVKPPVPTKK